MLELIKKVPGFLRPFSKMKELEELNRSQRSSIAQLARMLAETQTQLIEAQKDEVTKLTNRALFLKKANILFEQSPKMSIIIIDLDGFKTINDTYGHAIGDKILYHFATILRDNLRDSELLGRIGGDEFAVATSGDRSEGQLILEKIKLCLANTPFTYQGTILSFGMSGGVGDNADSVTFEQMKHCADIEMYRDKHGDEYVQSLAMVH